MKLRIKGNTIRLRLTQREVTQIASGEKVEEKTVISPFFTFTCSIATWNILTTGLKWDDGQLEISVPEKKAKLWAVNNEESIKDEIENGTSDPLIVLVEKDYACLKEREGEDDSDNFPHPGAGIMKC